MINVEKGSIRLFINGKGLSIQIQEELINRDLFHRIGFSPFLFRFFDFLFFDRFLMRREVVRVRIPETVKKVIESSNTGSIPKLKAAEDSIKRIDL